jgi:NAD+ kinase
VKCVGIFANTNKEIIGDTLRDFFIQIKNSPHSFVITDSLKEIFPDTPDHIHVKSLPDMLDSSSLVLSFGGDGTMLRSAQLVGKKEIPILGINLGGLGFLTSSPLEKAIVHIDSFFANKITVEPRSLLELTVDGESDSQYFLNDFVVDKADFARLINITVTIDSQLLHSYTADGLIISTPTGSTAYSLANGGPIVEPQINSFIVNPICPHTLSNRPLIIPDKSKIAIRVESELDHYNIFGDGNKIGTYSLKTGLSLKRASHQVYLVQAPGHEFYKIIREKLGWGEDFRTKIRNRNNG